MNQPQGQIAHIDTQIQAAKAEIDRLDFARPSSAVRSATLKQHIDVLQDQRASFVRLSEAIETRRAAAAFVAPAASPSRSAAPLPAPVAPAAEPAKPSVLQRAKAWFAGK